MDPKNYLDFYGQSWYKLAMHHFLVIHNAHAVPDTTPWHIYLHKVPNSDKLPRPGDSLLFYETLAKGAAGLKGRGRIVRRGTVTGELETAGPEADGRSWKIPCDSLPFESSVDAGAIGLLTTYQTLVGRDGLFPISLEEFEALLQYRD